jgi:hypothetical protein
MGGLMSELLSNGQNQTNTAPTVDRLRRLQFSICEGQVGQKARLMLIPYPQAPTHVTTHTDYTSRWLAWLGREA